MNWPAQCAAVIPCFNEAAQVAEVVGSVRAHLPVVLVVDDGSSDDTSRLATAAGAEVIRHESNRGKGAALQSGLQAARKRGMTWALLMDGDGQHAPADIPRFFQRAQAGDTPLIIGNRMAETRDMPAVRRLVNRWMSQRLSRLTGRELPDTQCGYRLVNLEAWAALPLKTARFEIESEMLVAFLAAGHSIGFVPITTIYKDEQSKIHPVRDTLRWFRWWQSARLTWRQRGSAAR